MEKPCAFSVTRGVSLKATLETLNIPEWVKQLVLAGAQAPSADNSQPWRFVWNGKNLTLHLDTVRAGAGLGLNHPANLMAMGAVIENLTRAAKTLGFPPDILSLESGSKDQPFATIAWDGPAPNPTIEADPGLFARHTNRGAFQKIPLSPKLIAHLTAMTEGRLRTVVVSEPRQKKHLAGWVRDASEVRFQTEEIHRWLGSSLRFTPEEVARNDGLDVATLLLPPGAIGLLKFSLNWRRMATLNRFGAYKLFAFLEAAMLQESAALILVAGPLQGDGNELAAGRLLERLWIKLNEEGIAVHPYFVLADQLYRLRTGLISKQFQAPVTQLAGRVSEFLGSGNETVYMLLRVGIAKINNPVRSRRLPAENTLSVLNMQ